MATQPSLSRHTANEILGRVKKELGAMANNRGTIYCLSVLEQVLNSLVSENEQFPIMADPGVHKSSTIPMWVAEVVYGHYVAKYGNSQSLERIGERGGFSREEITYLLSQRR